MTKARVTVTRMKDETTDSLIRRFKSQVKKDELIYEYSKHQEFLSKPLKRKEKSIHARKRLKARKHK